MMVHPGMLVGTAHGDGIVNQIRVDGIAVIQLTFCNGAPFVGYFHHTALTAPKGVVTPINFGAQAGGYQPAMSALTQSVPGGMVDMDIGLSQSVTCCRVLENPSSPPASKRRRSFQFAA